MRVDQCECGGPGLVYQTEQQPGVTIRRRKCKTCRATWASREVDGRKYALAPRRGSMRQPVHEWPDAGKVESVK